MNCFDQTPKNEVNSFYRKIHLPALLILAFSLTFCSVHMALGQGSIHQDAEQKMVTLSDGQGQLVLRLNYHGRCILDQVMVRGHEVISDSGVFTGIRTGGQWLTTKKIVTPDVTVHEDTLTVTGIKFGPPENEITETWQFIVKQHQIVWRITRIYPTDETLDDAAFPEWDFSNMSVWTGGLLDNGGVIWNKYLDKPDATYGAHFGTVTFWNSKLNNCLRVTPTSPCNSFGTGRFSRQPDDVFSFNYVVSGAELEPKYNLKRFLKNHQDLWLPFQVKRSKVSEEFTLEALDYSKTYNRGTFSGLDGTRIRDLLNTVARYGVIDKKLVGGNGWRSGYICLHEPFFSEIGLALDQDDYISNLEACLDFEREHAIGADGRVMSRWFCNSIEGKDGAYNSYGFLETRWGWLLDSQPDYVINVAEEFNLTGNKKWLAGEKSVCEKALNYLMSREVGNTGLVAMMNDSFKQKKSSDWIDVIWASYENAFVNVALYEALELWANDEDMLNDSASAAAYRAFAARLKTTFNRPIAEGGFWDPTNQWYVYWRDKDGSIHGNNLVTPINFAAIAYGICENSARRKAILDRMEKEMQREGLFSWPLNFFPYKPDEGGSGNFPFPHYENGDIFLSWNELGVRAYSDYKPSIALKYVRNTLARYGEDGLSFQRYLRQSQKGSGADILAGNCMTIVGLYRDIYGIQPKHNRLYLEPHLTSELNGTELRYNLRGRLYSIDLNTKVCAITAGNCTFRDSHPFGINAVDSGLEYFPGMNADWELYCSTPNENKLTIKIESWPEDPDEPHQWTAMSSSSKERTHYVVRHLRPKAVYELKVNGRLFKTVKADNSGQISFRHIGNSSFRQIFRLTPAF